MTTATRPTTSAPIGAASSSTAAGTSLWAEIVEQLPVMVVVRAVQEIRRKAAHRQLVLQAFRR